MLNHPIRTAAFLAVVLLAAPVGAQDAPSVRPARAAAVTTPLADADLGWILPLLAAQAADVRRERAATGAAVAALGEAAAPETGDARIARIRSGRSSALDELRGHSRHAAVPAGARYQPLCSAGITEGIGGLSPVAMYLVSSVAEAREFYRAAGFEVLGQASVGYVINSPDRRLSISLGSSAADVRKLGRMPGYAHLRECAALPAEGATLVIQANGEFRALADAAASAATGGSAERLPGALARAGLTAAQWDAVVTLLWEAATDDMYAGDPAALDQVAGSPVAGARRRANLAWFARNRAVIDPALAAASGS